LVFASHRYFQFHTIGAIPRKVVALSTNPAGLLDRLFTTDAMRGIFCDRRYVQSMLDFESGLARALVRTGIAPASVLPAIESSCDASLFDLETLSVEAATAGNLAIPLVKRLTALVGKGNPQAMRFVHWGATSQDVIDTGLVLQLRDAFDVVDADLAAMAAALAKLARDYRDTLLPGRTLLQHAAPVTFGFKVAGWLAAMQRHRERLRQTRVRAVVLQFGGAVGTLAAFGGQGSAVAEALASELKLAGPDLSWHTHRDSLAEVATTLGLLTGTLGKIARDVSLLAQSEVGEVLEPAAAGRGGSSTMPHKRNPVGAAVVLAAAIRVPALVATMLSAMVQEHERGLGGWHAEWQTLPEICLLSAGALSHLAFVVTSPEIFTEKMRADLDLTRGLILSEAVSMALAAHIGKQPAHEIMERASRRTIESGAHLREVLLADQEVTRHVSSDEIRRLLDPANYTGVALEGIDRVLQKYSGNQ
jgi:3-carboxy-cis,cis-muconate cycloisomerase